MRTLALAGFLAALCRVTTAVAADDLTAQKLAWAHYVPWYVPANVSSYPSGHYEFPVHEKGTDPHRHEIERAQAMGLDGFFVDIITQYTLAPGGTRYRPGYYWVVGDLLQAAAGRDFWVAPCLDGKTDVATQVDDIVWMLEQYGGHPNYPRIGERYVVATYVFREWTPQEWRQMIDGCAARGYPIFLVANAKYSCGVLLPSQLDSYKDVMDVVYSFAYVGLERWTTDVENRSTAAWCAANGRHYMPCINPGYSGSWLMETNAGYQPHLGVDKMMREVTSMLDTGGAWLHFTSWNDFCETAMEPTPLTPGYPQFVRAISDAFKGGAPSAAKPDVLLAYLRENLPGTLLRIEAMRLPAAQEAAVSVGGVLEDATGRIVRTLPAQALTSTWARVEWLVPSTELAFSPCVRPRLRLTLDTETVERSFPELFFHTPWIENPVTVKATFGARAGLAGSLSVTQSAGRFQAVTQFASASSVRRAILFWNGRPAGQFSAAGAHCDTYPDTTLRELPTLDSTGGTYTLSVAGRDLKPADVFWVRYECADGTSCESRPVWPQPCEPATRRLPILETSVTSETLPGTQGLPPLDPDVPYGEFLTPEEDWPVRGTHVVTAEVAVAALRTERWPLDGNGRCEFGSRPATAIGTNGVCRLPLRVWPMDSAEVGLDLILDAAATNRETVIGRVGTGAAFTLDRLADDRLVAEWSGRGRGGVWDVQIANRTACTSDTSVTRGAWHRVRLVNDQTSLRIVVDDRRLGSCAWTAYRAYGPSAVTIGGDGSGEKRFGGRVANVTIAPYRGQTSGIAEGDVSRTSSSVGTAVATVDTRSGTRSEAGLALSPGSPLETRDRTSASVGIGSRYPPCNEFFIIIR